MLSLSIWHYRSRNILVLCFEPIQKIVPPITSKGISPESVVCSNHCSGSALFDSHPHDCRAHFRTRRGGLETSIIHRSQRLSHQFILVDGGSGFRRIDHRSWYCLVGDNVPVSRKRSPYMAYDFADGCSSVPNGIYLYRFSVRDRSGTGSNPLSNWLGT